jgi:hypothetical protein
VPTEPISLQARRVVWLLAAAVFINYFDRGNLATASPLLQRELALSNSELGALFSALFFGPMRHCNPSRAGWRNGSTSAMCSAAVSLFGHWRPLSLVW